MCSKIEKALLAVIAAGLLWNGLNPWLLPRRAIAEDPTPVRIVEIDRHAFWNLKPIPVEISE